MGILILKDLPIAYIEEISAIVITDLHIGFECELEKNGIKIPFQEQEFVEILKNAKERTNSKKIILLGDVKHKVPRAKKIEIVRIKEFLKKLSEEFEKVIICKGNHDDKIEYIVPENVEVKSSRGFLYKNYGFFHGHAWPFSKLWNAKNWLIGHLQPMIEVYKNGKKVIERVVIKGKPKRKTGKLENIIILPSFNPLVGGLILNKTKNLQDFIFEKILDLHNSLVFLLDGTEIDSLENILNY